MRTTSTAGRHRRRAAALIGAVLTVAVVAAGTAQAESTAPSTTAPAPTAPAPTPTTGAVDTAVPTSDTLTSPAASPSPTTDAATPTTSAAATTEAVTAGTATAATTTTTTTTGTPTATPGPTPDPTPAVAATPVRPDPTQLRIVNYYPADAAWTAMWTAYSHSRTDTDFAAIAGLHATTVRIIVQPDGVGWPTVTVAGAAELRDMIDTAAAHGLTVQLTLFDLWYGWTEVSASKAWVSQLLSPYRDDPRIVLVELRNEIDVNYQPALSWARDLLPYLATVLPGVPRTLSSNTAATVRALGAAIPASSWEVVDIHLYGDLGAMPAYVAAAREVADGRPVIVGEAGRTTGDAHSVGSEQGQLTYYQAVAQLTRDSGLGVFAPWTLTDFELAAIPAPFRTASEASFGLRRLDGSWKPAAAVVRTMFGDPGVPAVDPTRPAAAALDYDPGFENSDATPSNLGRLGTWRVFDAAAIGSVGAVSGAGVTGAAVALSATGGSASMVPAVYQSFLLLSGRRTLTAAANVRVVSGTGFSRVAVAWFDGPVYLGSSESVNAVNGLTGWQRVTVTGTAPASATSFQVHLKAAYNSGSTFFDDVSLT